MRALIIALVVVAFAAGGFLLYRQQAPQAANEKLFAAPPPPAAPAKAEDCPPVQAFYQLADDARLQLRLIHNAPPPGAFEVAEAGGHLLGNMNLVVHITSFGQDFTLRPDNNFPAQGPAYSTTQTHVRLNGTRLAVSTFDSEHRYITHLPRNDEPAPDLIFIPDLMRHLYASHVDLSPGMFHFVRCEQPPAAATSP